LRAGRKYHREFLFRIAPPELGFKRRPGGGSKTDLRVKRLSLRAVCVQFARRVPQREAGKTACGFRTDMAVIRGRDPNAWLHPRRGRRVVAPWHLSRGRRRGLIFRLHRRSIPDITGTQPAIWGSPTLLEGQHSRVSKNRLCSCVSLSTRPAAESVESEGTDPGNAKHGLELYVLFFCGTTPAQTCHQTCPCFVAGNG